MKSITSALIVVILVAVVATVEATQSPSARAQLFHPIHQQQQQQQQAQLRSVYDTLPEVGDSIESYLQYCEAVIHALESELPRKSVFRSLFIDKARLSSGYDKHIKFTYYDILKNKINDLP